MLRPLKCMTQINCILACQLEVLKPTVKHAISTNSQRLLWQKTAYHPWQLAPQHFYLHSGPVCCQCQQAKSKEKPIKQALVESKDRPFSELTLGQKGINCLHDHDHFNSFDIWIYNDKIYRFIFIAYQLASYFNFDLIRNFIPVGEVFFLWVIS